MPHTIQMQSGESFDSLWVRCGGYYECPKDPQGNRLGPLVSYAGTYDGAGEKHYVGDDYYNFALVEEHPNVLDHFAGNLGAQLAAYKVTAVVGAPLGGIGLAQALSRVLRCRFLYAEKEILELGRWDQKEKSKLVWGRHTVGAGDLVVIVEDVCNNFSTTKKLWNLIASCSASTMAVVCALNRSWERDFVVLRNSFELPILSLPVTSVIYKRLLQ